MVGCLLTLALLLPATATAASPNLGAEEGQGQRIAESVRAGKRTCSQMMGEARARRMHMALGHRFLSCGGGPTAGWMGPMAGMMFGRGSGYGPGMMGGGFGAHHGDHDWPSMAAVAAIGAALLAAIVVGFLWLDRRRAA
ncbi:MAG TPA: hypothetical protein VFI17_00755 [Solirubrobacterales bacterium]|nr:hypothetical protein [Solirubrobacterales bacterium]